MNKITLSRWYLPHATFGRLEVGGLSLFTVERKWNDNRPFRAQDPDGTSCIPEGMYQLNWRRSGVVERSTRGKYLSGWEVAEVENRTFIMFHPGNTIQDVIGCIAPGTRLGVVNNQWAVMDSQTAFQSFMDAVTPDRDWFIEIVTEGAPWSRWK